MRQLCKAPPLKWVPESGQTGELYSRTSTGTGEVTRKDSFKVFVRSTCGGPGVVLATDKQWREYSHGHELLKEGGQHCYCVCVRVHWTRLPCALQNFYIAACHQPLNAKRDPHHGDKQSTLPSSTCLSGALESPTWVLLSLRMVAGAGLPQGALGSTRTQVREAAGEESTLRPIPLPRMVLSTHIFSLPVDSDPTQDGAVGPSKDPDPDTVVWGILSP